MSGDAKDLGVTSYGESLEAHLAFGASILRCVREGPWKYIHGATPELYDVVADPEEQRNLAAEQPEIAGRLRGRLRELLASAPRGPQDAAVAIDSKMLSELAALGYVGVPEASPIEDELATLDASGRDAKSVLEAIELIGMAHGAYKIENYARSLEIFSRLDAEFPNRLPMLSGQIDSLIALGRPEDAIPLLRRSVAAFPDFVPHQELLARLLHRQGGSDEAERILRAAFERSPCTGLAGAELANLMLAQGRIAEQFALLEKGVEVCPDAVAFRNDLAYALATTPDAARRDGARALALIEPLTAHDDGGQRATLLDTLAAAYAELGEFEKAAEHARQAVALVEGAGMPDETLAGFRHNLAEIEAGRPVRQH
jgi:tetratricopeptide (TPR) repeat protein